MPTDYITLPTKAYKYTASNQNSEISNPDVATAEFTSSEYTNIQSDNSVYASTTASATLVARYGNTAHKFVFDLSAYSGITRIRFKFDGYASGTLYHADIWHKTTSGWVNDGTIPSSDDTGFEFTLDLTDISSVLIDGTFTFGIRVTCKYVTSSVNATSNTDYVELEVDYTTKTLSVSDTGSFSDNIPVSKSEKVSDTGTGVDSFYAPFRSTYLYARYLDGTYSEWTGVGVSPYVDIAASTTSQPDPDRIECSQANKKMGYFYFSRIVGTSYIKQVKLQVLGKCSSVLDSVRIHVWDGTTWNTFTFSFPSTWTWREQDISTVLNTVEKLNMCKIIVESLLDISTAIDCIRLQVDGEAPAYGLPILEGSSYSLGMRSTRTNFRSPRGLKAYYYLYYDGTYLKVRVTRDFETYSDYTVTSVSSLASAEMRYDKECEGKLVILITYVDGSGNCYFVRGTVLDGSTAITFDSPITLFTATSNDRVLYSKVVVTDSGYYAVIYDRAITSDNVTTHSLRCRITDSVHPSSPSFASEQTIFTSPVSDLPLYFDVTAVGWKGNSEFCVVHKYNDGSFNVLASHECNWDGTNFSITATFTAYISDMVYDENIVAVNRPGTTNPKIDIIVPCYNNYFYYLQNRRVTPGAHLSPVVSIVFRSLIPFKSITSTLGDDQRTRTCVFSLDGESRWLYFVSTDTMTWQSQYPIYKMGVEAPVLDCISAPHDGEFASVHLAGAGSDNKIYAINFNSPRCFGNFQANVSVDARGMIDQGKKLAYRFLVERPPKTLSTIYVYVVVYGNAPQLRIGVQSDNAGYPSGTWIAYQDVTPSSTGYLTISLNTTLTNTNNWIVIECRSQGDTLNYAAFNLWSPLCEGYPKDNYYSGTYSAWYDGTQWTRVDATGSFLVTLDNVLMGYPFDQQLKLKVYGTNRVCEVVNMPSGLLYETQELQVYLRKVGTPSNPLYVRIEHVTGTIVLDSTVLCIPDTAPTEFAPVSLVFPKKTLYGGSSYRVIFHSSGGDSSNCYEILACQTSDSTFNDYTYNGTLSHVQTASDGEWMSNYSADISLLFVITSSEVLSVTTSIQVDSLLSALHAIEMAADSLLNFVRQTELTSDVMLFTKRTMSLNLDSMLMIIRQTSISCDVFLSKTTSIPIQTDVLLRVTYTLELSTSMFISKVSSLVLQADAVIFLTSSLPFLADAILKLISSIPLDVDTVIKIIRISTLTTDMMVSVAHAVPLSVDLDLSITRTVAVTVDSLLLASLSKTLDTDVLLKSVHTSTIGMDTFLLKQSLKMFDVDLVLKLVSSISISADSILIFIRGVLISSDVLLNKLSASLLDIDVILGSTPLVQIAIDTLVTGLVSTQLSISAFVSTIRQTSFQLDMISIIKSITVLTADLCIEQVTRITLSLDTVIGYLKAQTISLDAFLLQTCSYVLSVSALIGTATVVELFVDMFTSARLTTSLILDLLLSWLRTTSGQVDTLISTKNSVAYTASVLVGVLTIAELEVSCLLKGLAQQTLTTDLLISRKQLISNSVDAILHYVHTAMLMVDSFVYQIVSLSFSADTLMSHLASIYMSITVILTTARYVYLDLTVFVSKIRLAQLQSNCLITGVFSKELTVNVITARVYIVPKVYVTDTPIIKIYVTDEPIMETSTTGE